MEQLFSRGILLEYVNNFEHPRFQPHYTRLYFFGLFIQNKNQIRRKKIIKKLLAANFRNILIIVSIRIFSRTSLEYVFTSHIKKVTNKFVEQKNQL